MTDHVLILEARFYDDLANDLQSAATDELDRAGITYDIQAVPGSYELPAALSYAVNGGLDYDGYLILGTLIRGQTSHYDLICDAVGQELQRLITDHQLAVGFGLLTCDDYDQVKIRADQDGKDYGGKAARALIRMLELKSDLMGELEEIV
jgi:6,7-dimethyl-8-ribityllumazine synthase